MNCAFPVELFASSVDQVTQIAVRRTEYMLVEETGHSAPSLKHLAFGEKAQHSGL
jgi:hypothetical protein